MPNAINPIKNNELNLKPPILLNGGSIKSRSLVNKDNKSLSSWDWDLKFLGIMVFAFPFCYNLTGYYHLVRSVSNF